MQTEQIEQDGGALVTRSEEVQVVDAASYEAAAEFLLGIKDYRKRVAGFIGPVVKDAHTAWKTATAKRAELDAPADKAERIVKGRMLAWSESEDRRARAEAAAAEVAAQKAAEETQLAEAEAAEAAGDAEAADAILEAPPVVTPIVARAAAPKVAGISTRSVWRFEVTDVSLVPRQYLEPDLTKIGGVVRAMKGQARIPGVRVYEEKVMGAGRRS